MPPDKSQLETVTLNETSTVPLNETTLPQPSNLIGQMLDERYFMYAEDVDFCAAIRARGRTIRFASDVTVVHHRGRSAATVPAATEQAYRRSQIAFYEKHHPRWTPVLRLYLRLRRIEPPEAGRPGQSGKGGT